MKKLSLQDKAFIALKEAIKELIHEKRKKKQKVSIWKDGKVVRIIP